jgi:nucleotide-binding universal stress UspA family protein
VHILIATTGVLPPGPVADICERVLGPDDEITVMTVIEVPRHFLESMEDGERRSFLDTASWETDTAEMKALTYLEERGRRVVEPIMAALRSRGHSPAISFVEGPDPVEAIVSTSEKVGASLIVMGATRRLFTEQAWMSVSARVMERTQCPLLLVPGVRSEDAGEARSEDDE